MLTFGEIGPQAGAPPINLGGSGASGYASPIPRGLGLNGAGIGGSVTSLAVGSPRLGSMPSLGNGSGAVGTASPLTHGSSLLNGNGFAHGSGSSNTSAFSSTTATTPSLVFGSTANVNTTLPANGSSVSTDEQHHVRRARLPSFAETESDFPTIINYSEMGDYLGDVEDLDDEDPSHGDMFGEYFAGTNSGLGPQDPNMMGPGFDKPNGQWPGPPAGYGGYAEPYADDQWRMSYKSMFSCYAC